jgi:hypothetical protein
MRAPVIELFYDVASPCEQNYIFLITLLRICCRADHVACTLEGA